jgi:hypothetical protein
VVIFADCCRERVGNVPLGAVPGILPEKNNGKIVAAFGCATYFGDLAYEPPPDEDPDEQRGYFTQAILEGLRGQAAEPPVHGEINSNTLAKYVKQRVLDLTKHRKQQQDPAMYADPAMSIVFRPVPTPPVDGSLPLAAVEHEVRIEFLTAYQGKVALRDTGNNILRQRDRDAFIFGEGCAGLAPSNWPGPFFAARSWAGCTNMFGFDLRQAHRCQRRRLSGCMIVRTCRIEGNQR